MANDVHNDSKKFRKPDVLLRIESRTMKARLKCSTGLDAHTVDVNSVQKHLDRLDSLVLKFML